jgi:hypothetical protein
MWIWKSIRGGVEVMDGSSGRKRPLWVPLGPILGGVLLFLFAASGGFVVGGVGLTIEGNAWKLLLSAVGVGLMAAGVLMLADEENEGAAPRARKGAVGTADWRIKIIRPVRFQRQMRVEGGYLNRPPDGMLRLFTVMEDGRFRPQSVVTFDEANRRWSGKVDLGAGPYYSVYVVAAFVDAAGLALWDYYYQVGRETNWEPVVGSFGEYALECDRFLVEGVINE